MVTEKLPDFTHHGTAFFYALARIFGEFFREPDPQLGFLWGGLTMGMLLSVPMILAGAILIVNAWRKPARFATPVEGTP